MITLRAATGAAPAKHRVLRDRGCDCYGNRIAITVETHCDIG